MVFMDPLFSYSLEEPKPVECPGEYCCSHIACAPLRERALCRAWNFLRWLPADASMPSEILKKLREQLGYEKLRYCLCLNRRTEVYEVLLRLDENHHLIHPELLRPCLQSAGEQSSRVEGAWRLACCWDVHEMDAKVWAEAMTQKMESLSLGTRDCRTSYSLT